jgi:hypothetical protein
MARLLQLVDFHDDVHGGLQCSTLVAERARCDCEACTGRRASWLHVPRRRTQRGCEGDFFSAGVRRTDHRLLKPLGGQSVFADTHGHAE